VSLINGIKKHN